LEAVISVFKGEMKCLRNIAAPIPQIRHYYRYGNLRDCVQEREEFAFCFSVAGLPADERKRRVQERLTLKEERKRRDRSTADRIWKVRGGIRG
jgi:hypothetical protein